jgi:hypothetical protein
VLAANAGETPNRLRLMKSSNANREMGWGITINFNFFNPIHLGGQKKSPVSIC